MKITLYTITDCKFSQQEKDYLKKNNLPFEEKNLETNKDFLTEMLNVSNNFAGTPVTVIEKDGGQKVVLKGFTQEEFDKELNLGAPAPATTGEVKAPEVPAAAPAMTPEPVTPPAPPAPEPPAPAPLVPEAPATGTMPEMPAAPTMPPVPPAPEPVMPPPAPTTPSIEDKPMDMPAPAPIVPDMGAPAMPSPTEMPSPSETTMPAAPAPLSPVEPAAPVPSMQTAPAAPTPVVPTGTVPSPAANDDALNAILNNLQEKVNADAPKPPAPQQ